jgi:DNA-binding NarL/FixJ family response regulator
MKIYRIILADDHAVMRQGLKRIIEEIPGVEVIAETSDGLELMVVLKKITPDMVILDISMPNLRGIEATGEIRKLYPDIKVLLLTMHKNKDYVYHAFAAGAHGYLLKEDSDTELLSAIEAIRNGNIYLTERLSNDMIENISQTKYTNQQKPLDPLSLREREVLKLIAEGKNNKQVAELLFISNRTVDNHRARMMKKLNFNNSVDLIKYALKNGYI